MTFKMRIFALGSVALAGPAFAEQTISAPVHYACERGAQIQVVYVNLPDTPGHAILSAEGQMIVLEGMEAASGVSYGTGEGQPGYRWRTQGDDAMLGYLSEEGDEEQTLLRACQTKQP